MQDTPPSKVEGKDIVYAHYWSSVKVLGNQGYKQIDIDTEKGQRFNILEKVKEKFGRRKVINIATFKTEGTVSAIQTICRGMGITTEESSYISSLAVDGMTVKECLDNFETNRECGILIREMMAYEGLIESVIAIEGLICGRSIHASGKVFATFV